MLGNLLNLALPIQPKQSVIYTKWASKTENAIGMLVSSYDDPFSLIGSFQPIPRTSYQQYGLDLSKDYATFYASSNMLGVDRDYAGDVLLYDGAKWQCEAVNKWFSQNGWVGGLFVKIGAA